MGIIGGLIIGGIAGYLAGKVMKSNNGIIVNIILGIVGGGIGPFALSLIGLGTMGVMGEIVSGTVGAIIIIYIGRKIIL
tara:strand:+ start:69 stop:305 length:237 start_codon:yes stop_codon:yes gene_type:complete